MQSSTDNWESIHQNLYDSHYGEQVPAELVLAVLAMCPSPEAACGRYTAVEGQRLGTWEAFAIQGASITYVKCEPAADDRYSGLDRYTLAEARIWPISEVRAMGLLEMKRRGSDETTISWLASWKLIMADGREIVLPVPYAHDDDRERFATAVRDRLAVG